MIKVTCFDYTGAGTPNPAHYALAVLSFAKNTRVTLRPEGFQDALYMMYDQLLEEAAYAANTIPSSWEFVTYSFLIENVTRAFTHQLVRTRNASYAQQTMRTLDVTDFSYTTGRSIAANHAAKEVYDGAMLDISNHYRELIELGIKPEDARGIIPTNIRTNIMMKMDLRCLVSWVQSRSSARTQGEYRDVVDLVKLRAMEVHPWLHLFLDRTHDKAIAEIEQEIDKMSEPQRTKLLKLFYQVRTKT